MRGRGWFAGALLLLAAGFAALGVWQVERRGWKLALIAQVNARLAAAPVPLPRRPVGPSDAYTRVTASGCFDHGRETLVQALTERGAGFWVLTPLMTRDGPVLVNRGFVPPERATPATRRPHSGPTTVTGLLRLTEPGGAFLRRNDASANRWYSRDVAAIARARGLAHAAPYFIDADATANPGGWPLGGLTVVTFRNTHLLYALTWFALAVMAAFGAAFTLRSRR